MKNRFYDSVEIPFAEPWRIINLAEANNELHGAPKIKYPEEVYFESTQVFVKRTDNGILLAAKGGNKAIIITISETLWFLKTASPML